MIRLVEVIKKSAEYDPKIGMNKSVFSLREVFVNPQMIVSARDEIGLQQKNSRDQIIDDLNKDSEFTALTLNAGTNGKTITVVGSVYSVCERLGMRLWDI